MTYSATDAYGNKTVAAAVVTIPHDQKGGKKQIGGYKFWTRRCRDTGFSALGVLTLPQRKEAEVLVLTA